MKIEYNNLYTHFILITYKRVPLIPDWTTFVSIYLSSQNITRKWALRKNMIHSWSIIKKHWN